MFSSHITMNALITDALFKFLLFSGVSLDLVWRLMKPFSGFVFQAGFQSQYLYTIQLSNIWNCRQIQDTWGFGNNHLCIVSPTHSVKVLERSFKQGVMLSIPPHCSLWRITLLLSQWPWIINYWIIIIPPFNASLITCYEVTAKTRAA